MNQQEDRREPPLRETSASSRGRPHIEAEGLATGLQPGGVIPGGGPGESVGSIGTGGGSNADTPTGDAAKNNIEEEVR